MTPEPDPPCDHNPVPFVRILIERNVVLPDGSPHGSVVGVEHHAAPVSADLLALVAEIVARLDQSTAEAIAEEHGPEAGLAFLDEVAAAEARWADPS